MAHSKVIIIDYGSQVTQLIARRVREAGVYSEIHACDVTADAVRDMRPSAVILSGGPASVGEEDAPALDKGLLDLGVPVLGICYGMQLLAQSLGGTLAQSRTREYGPADLTLRAPCALWEGLDPAAPSRVWMSHGDRVTAPPPGFAVTASTATLDIAAMADEQRRIYAVQFHPEVHHSVDGDRMLRNFLFGVARIVPDWTMSSFVERAVREAAETVGDRHVVCALSGGIDSTVVAVLLHKAIGHRLHCIFVDNGLLRLNEAEQVAGYLREHFDLNLTVVQARDRFLNLLKGVEDPEKKRKISGHTFIDIFEEESHKLPSVDFLAQGTLYPDVIESVPIAGNPASLIKSHHNVGGLPKNMKLKLLEPLRELFKDEVRALGKELGLSKEVLWRHPFPGPGLGVRVVGDITKKRCDILREADAILLEEMKASGLYYNVWQAFAVFLPVKTVGVMGDERTYDNVIALRIVESQDAMTADWAHIPHDVLAKISSRIINEVKGVNRVCLDISSKPPATIEWE